jgi:DNA-binding transcriptional regulator PaaX
MLREVGFSHNTLRLRLARLERQGMVVKAASACASKLPQNSKRGINTIFIDQSID